MTYVTSRKTTVSSMLVYTSATSLLLYAKRLWVQHRSCSAEMCHSLDHQPCCLHLRCKRPAVLTSAAGPGQLPSCPQVARRLRTRLGTAPFTSSVNTWKEQALEQAEFTSSASRHMHAYMSAAAAGFEEIELSGGQLVYHHDAT